MQYNKGVSRSWTEIGIYSDSSDESTDELVIDCLSSPFYNKHQTRRQINFYYIWRKSTAILVLQNV